MKKLILLTMLALALLPVIAAAQYPIAGAEGPRFTKQQPLAACVSGLPKDTILFTTSATLAKSKSGTWTYGNVVGITAYAKKPFRVKAWANGTTSAVWAPVDTVAAAQAMIGNYGIEYPVVFTFWAELDSIDMKPASSDTIWYAPYLE